LLLRDEIVAQPLLRAMRLEVRACFVRGAREIELYERSA
jgi:hypothetical protein